MVNVWKNVWTTCITTNVKSQHKMYKCNLSIYIHYKYAIYKTGITRTFTMVISLFRLGIHIICTVCKKRAPPHFGLAIIWKMKTSHNLILRLNKRTAKIRIPEMSSFVSEHRPLVFNIGCFLNWQMQWCLY